MPTADDGPPPEWLEEFQTPPETLAFGATVRMAMADATQRFGYFAVENLGTYLMMFFNYPDRFSDAYEWWQEHGPVSLVSEQWEGFCAIIADIVSRY